MKNIFIAFFLVSGTLTANANPVVLNVSSMLAKVEREMDACGVVKLTNSLIKMGKSRFNGDAVVDVLSESLSNIKVGSSSKASAAMALGHIGHARAVNVLEQTVNTTSDSWLKSISQDSISMIKGELPRDKVYVFAFAVKKLKIDCEAGTSVEIK